MKTYQILIVEDDLQSANSLQVRLKTIGYAITNVCNNGEDALEFAKHNNIDLLLMDIQLNGKIDGIDTAEKLLTIQHVPIIFLTASQEEETWKRAKYIEPFAYLFKPFDLKELQVTIDMALYKYEMEKKLKDTEDRYRSVVEDQTELIWRINDSGKVTFCNGAFLYYFSLNNYDEQDIYFYDLVQEETYSVFLSNLNILDEMNPVVEFDLDIKYKDKLKILRVILRKLFQSTIEYQIVAKDVTEEEEATRMLRQNEEFYRVMFEEGLSADFISSVEGRLIHCNQKFLSLYELPSLQVAKSIDLYSLYPENVDRDNILKNIRRSKQFINKEVCMKTYKGRTIWVLSNMIGVFDDDGNLVRMRGYEIDITDKKRAENALVESEEQARALFHGNADPIFLTDLEDKCIDLNHSFTKLFGFTTQELYGNEFPGKQGIDNGKFEEWVEICKNGGGISDYETIRRAKNGRFIPVSITISPIKDSAGNLKMLSFWYRDISERKQIEAEKELVRAELEIKVRERTAELRAMYDQSPIGMCIFDSNGRIIEINERWKNIWHIKTINRDYSVFDDSYFNAYSVISDIQEIFVGGGSITLQPLYYDDFKDNLPGPIKGKWLKHTFYSIQNEAGRVVQIVNLVEDVSESKRAEEITERYEKQRLITKTIIETLEQERKRLSKEVHDGIGQMLTAAKLSIELFEKESKLTNDNLRDAKNILYNIASEVENLINALRPAIFDSYGLIKAVEIMCNEFEELTDIQFNFCAYDFEDRLAANLEVNLYRIIQEAISNIAKHSKATNASIQLFNREDEISILIEDNGIGFSLGIGENDKERLGGFGLISIRERAELLGGSIHFETALGKGTEIHIEIPKKYSGVHSEED